MYFRWLANTNSYLLSLDDFIMVTEPGNISVSSNFVSFHSPSFCKLGLSMKITAKIKIIIEFNSINIAILCKWLLCWIYSRIQMCYLNENQCKFWAQLQCQFKYDTSCDEIYCNSCLTSTNMKLSNYQSFGFMVFFEFMQLILKCNNVYSFNLRFIAKYDNNFWNT